MGASYSPQCRSKVMVPQYPSEPLREIVAAREFVGGSMKVGEVDQGMIVRRRVTMLQKALQLLSVLYQALPHADSDSPSPNCFTVLSGKRACRRKGDRMTRKLVISFREKRRGGKTQQRKACQ